MPPLLDTPISVRFGSFCCVVHPFGILCFVSTQDAANPQGCTQVIPVLPLQFNRCNQHLQWHAGVIEFKLQLVTFYSQRIPAIRFRRLSLSFFLGFASDGLYDFSCRFCHICSNCTCYQSREEIRTESWDALTCNDMSQAEHSLPVFFASASAASIFDSFFFKKSFKKLSYKNLAPLVWGSCRNKWDKRTAVSDSLYFRQRKRALARVPHQQK